MSERKRYQMLIDGEWVERREGGKTFESVNPATGAVWAEIPEASEADVNRAVEAAHRAFLEGPWSKTTPSERGRSLRKLADSAGRELRVARPHRDRRHRQDAEGDPLAG